MVARDRLKRLKAGHSISCGEVAVGFVPRDWGKARKHFDQRAEQIVLEWSARKIAQGGGESPTSWFKRNLYRLIKAYVDAGHSGHFATMAKQSGRALVGLAQIQDNPFKLALFGMWSDNESLTRQQQRVWGEQMLYAYKHGVPPEHLIGFIWVAGSPQTIAQKLILGSREPGFEMPNAGA